MSSSTDDNSDVVVALFAFNLASLRESEIK